MFGPQGNMPSPLKHEFSRVPKADIQRSTFNRSHGLKTAFDAGYLVPIFVDEALPGDTFTLSMNGFGRLATPINPIFDNIHMETFFFAVPHRLVWNNWEKFCGEQDNPGDSTDYLVPTVSGTASVSELYDYMGIPTGVSLTWNNLAGRAYNLIWNEWFRDENLQDSVVVDKGDGPDTITDYVLLKRGKRHDYFTSCLPWPQKGDAVTLPLGTSAPVTAALSASSGQRLGVYSEADAALKSIATSGTYANLSTVAGVDPLYADLSDATAATINDLREAFQIQKLYERDARGGTRYTEIIQSHFGVTSPDARLQRPEYLGGGRSNVQIHPISQTSSTDATTPQGNMSAFGTAGFEGHGFSKSFTEHCVIIGMINVYADLMYQQGINRMWKRQDRWDFYWPALAHIGEQAVLNQEIYAQGTADDTATFGYQERYAEYRYKPSMVTGIMRSQAAGTLDSWHLAQDFGSLPALNASFIEENPPIDRVIAVPSEPHLLFDAWFNMKCARPMPTYSVPGLIDHF